MPIRSKTARPVGRSDNQPDYATSFLGRVHTLVRMGYDRLNHGKYQTSEEPAITGELVRAMREWMEGANTPPWVGCYTIHDESPQNQDGRIGKHRGRVDIEFERVRRGKRPRFQFEAKRLCDQSTDADYCGREGLGRFRSGEYAPDHTDAGMLGYVQTRDEPTWASRIEARLQGDPRRFGLRSDGKWKQLPAEGGLSFRYRTRHDRERNLGTITISHVLLQFC